MNQKKADQLFEALGDPADERFSIAAGEVAGIKSHFILCENQEGEDVPVAMLLDSKILKALEDLEGDPDGFEIDASDEEAPRRRRTKPTEFEPE